MTKARKKRATRAEMIAQMEEKLARYKAEEAGKVDTSSEAGILKALRKRLRKTETALRAAQVTLNGVAASDGKGWTRSPIDEKIAHTERRLASQIETKRKAEEQSAAYPFDVERLSALVAAAEAGETVEMPDDLTPLPNEQERTDEEHEAAFIANGEKGSRDND